MTTTHRTHRPAPAHAPLWATATLIEGTPRRPATEEALLAELGLCCPGAWTDAGVLRTAAARLRDHAATAPTEYRPIVRRTTYLIEDAQAEVWLAMVQRSRTSED